MGEKGMWTFTERVSYRGLNKFAVAIAGLAAFASTTRVFAQSAAIPEKTANGGTWAREVLPDYFVSFKMLDVSLWQWIGLIALIGVASILGLIVARLVFGIVYKLAMRSATPWDEALLARVVGPFRLVSSVAFFFLGSLFLQLPAQGDKTVTAICKILVVVAAAWLFSRLIDVACSYFEQTLDEKGDSATKTLVPLGRRVTKIFIFVIAGLSLLQNLGFNIGGLVAGLGIGGLAIALAAQKTLENLFGGFMLVADRPVKIGDYCRIGEHTGTVEDIGIRSSRIRTLDRTVVSIPNAELSTVRIENYGVRDKMRFYTVLQVGYDTSPDQMRFLIVELRKMLYAHPKTLPDPCRVRFLNLSAYSLDIEIYVFVDTQDWHEFTGIREDLFLRIMDIVEESGTYFAYPSQTLYLGQDTGRDLSSTAMAEQTVEDWRNSETLAMPEFTDEMITDVDDSLQYPVQGAVRREAADAG
jgi:MscS family membrane protein